MYSDMKILMIRGSLTVLLCPNTHTRVSFEQGQGIEGLNVEQRELLLSLPWFISPSMRVHPVVRKDIALFGLEMPDV